MKKRILFVDDEKSVLDGLRRALRSMRNVWEMEFVDSGALAIEKLMESPFDVVVSDIRMPEMNGVQLLQRVQKAYPNMARIVLTGHAGEENSTQLAKIAHQYLFKPVDLELLKKAVVTSCSMQSSVTDETVLAEIGGCDSLPSLPTLYMEITEAAASEQCTTKIIADIISRDMAMTAKLLQLVNSSFFGLGRRVSSIEMATGLLGVMQIKSIALTDAIFTQFSPREGTLDFSVERLWSHAFMVANVARQIAKEEKLSGDRVDQAYTAGLLHDIGILVLASKHAETVNESMKSDSMESEADDTDIILASHAAVGGHLLSLWGLPERIVEAVAMHHRPMDVSFDEMCAVSAVHAADVLSFHVDPDATESEKQMLGGELDIDYLKKLGKAKRVERWKEIALEAYEKTLVAQT